jgi:formylglycine-generating enzyme required for sulfatase activity
MTKIVSLFILFSTFLNYGSLKPPGTIGISDKLYMDQTEISNLDWTEHLVWLKFKYGLESEKYQNALPDLEIWKEVYGIDFKLIPTNKVPNNYPIVGISYNQAIVYCQWRTQVVNEVYKDKMEVKYRLPSIEEYKIAQKFEKKDTEDYFFHEQYKLHQLPSKTKGKFMLFLSSNVSEMTNELGIALTAEYGKTKNYSKAEKWLGFRCVAEIIE